MGKYGVYVPAARTQANPPHMSTQPSAAIPDPSVLTAQEGWFVQHLFYSIDHDFWEQLDSGERQARLDRMTAIVEAVRAHPRTQLLTLSVVSPKADLGFMLVTADLHDSNRFEKQLSLALGPGVLTPAYSYLSMTEWTEYSESAEEASARIAKTESLETGSLEHEARLAQWKTHMDKYYHDRLYPNLADWPVVCFYPMNKLRNVGANWWATEFSKRRELMAGHARTGRKYAGKVRQLVTGSTGLDTHEWSVTLFAHDLFQIKSIVYEMRFDEVSAVYAEFGDFFIGIQLPLPELAKRLLLA
jgi:peroxiredoxin